MEIKWSDILTHWIPTQLDLHEKFSIDTESGVLEHRTWWWLKDRILDLIDSPDSRLRRALDIPPDMTRD